MRRTLIAGNWKMHGSHVMTSELISGVAAHLGSLPAANTASGLGFDVLVCPPNVYLGDARAVIGDAPIKLGVQNVSAHEHGAYTGEVALSMLADFGVSHVLLGHSERRELFGESDDRIAMKFEACVESETGITPVLCVGETLEQRRAGTTEVTISQQLNSVIEVSGIEGFENAVVAYEPVWAIGTGETASPEQAQQVHAFIRNKLADLDKAVAANIQILYGGSMKPANALELLAQDDIDGGLIGGAALDVKSFTAICDAANELAGED